MQVPLRKQFKEAYETSESFSHKHEPLQQRKTDNLPFVTQIQDLMGMLISKKNELRELKLIQANIVSKGQQQEKRIKNMKIEMDHQIEKEELTRSQIIRHENDVTVCKQSILDLTNETRLLRHDTLETMGRIGNSKQTFDELHSDCQRVQKAIESKQSENASIDEQIQSIQLFLNSTENENRNKQDSLTQIQIRETELTTLLKFLKQKSTSARQLKSKISAKNKELDQQISKCQGKTHANHKEINEMKWTCEQVSTQNHQIKELNTRLQEDMLKVQNHHAMMLKTQSMLKNALMEYGLTGDKVTRIIDSAKYP